MRSIVVAVDGSDGSQRAAAFAAELARRFGASLNLLHVYDAPTAAALGMEALSADELERAKQSVAKGSFDAAREAIGSDAVTITTKVVLGHPAHEIVTYAKTCGADLIVVGRRGRSNLQTLLLGSVSEYVMRHSSCPVTVVH